MPPAPPARSSNSLTPAEPESSILPARALPEPRFLDANVLLRYFTGGEPAKAQRAKRLLDRVEQGHEKVATSTMIVFEVVFTLQRTYKVPKTAVREMVADVLSLRGLQLPRKDLCLEALALFVEKNISFADAYTAVYMRSRHLSEIYSWDSDFDRIEGLRRITPPP